MTTFFPALRKANAARSLVIAAAFGLLFASCSDKHLCPAYPSKPKIGKVENVAQSAPSVSPSNG